jgi:hypothetical protein
MPAGPSGETSRAVVSDAGDDLIAYAVRIVWGMVPQLDMRQTGVNPIRFR